MEKGLADWGHHSSSLKGHWLHLPSPAVSSCVSEPEAGFSLAPESAEETSGQTAAYSMIPDGGRPLVLLHGVYQLFP